MALCYVARRVGIPALRRASGPRMSPSAGSGPLASRSSQAGYSNGNATWKTNKQLVGQSLAEKEIDEVAEIRASFERIRESIKHANRMEKLKWRVFIGSGVAGVGLGLYYTFAYITRQVGNQAPLAHKYDKDNKDCTTQNCLN